MAPSAGMTDIPARKIHGDVYSAESHGGVFHDVFASAASKPVTVLAEMKMPKCCAVWRGRATKWDESVGGTLNMFFDLSIA